MLTMTAQHGYYWDTFLSMSWKWEGTEKKIAKCIFILSTGCYHRKIYVISQCILSISIFSQHLMRGAVSGWLPGETVQCLEQSYTKYFDQEGQNVPQVEFFSNLLTVDLWLKKKSFLRVVLAYLSINTSFQNLDLFLLESESRWGNHSLSKL